MKHALTARACPKASAALQLDFRVAGVDGHTSAAWVGEPPVRKIGGLVALDPSHPILILSRNAALEGLYQVFLYKSVKSILKRKGQALFARNETDGERSTLFETAGTMATLLGLPSPRHRSTRPFLNWCFLGR